MTNVAGSQYRPPRAASREPRTPHRALRTRMTHPAMAIPEIMDVEIGFHTPLGRPGTPEDCAGAGEVSGDDVVAADVASRSGAVP